MHPLTAPAPRQSRTALDPRHLFFHARHLTHVLGATSAFFSSYPSYSPPIPLNQPPTVTVLMPWCSGQQGQDEGRNQTEGADTQIISASPPAPAPQPPELFADSGFSEPGASPRVDLCRCQFIPETRTQESLPYTPSHALPSLSSGPLKLLFLHHLEGTWDWLPQDLSPCQAGLCFHSLATPPPSTITVCLCHPCPSLSQFFFFFPSYWSPATPSLSSP